MICIYFRFHGVLNFLSKWNVHMLLTPPLCKINFTSMLCHLKIKEFFLVLYDRSRPVAFWKILFTELFYQQHKLYLFFSLLISPHLFNTHKSLLCFGHFVKLGDLEVSNMVLFFIAYRVMGKTNMCTIIIQRHTVFSRWYHSSYFLSKTTPQMSVYKFINACFQFPKNNPLGP